MQKRPYCREELFIADEKALLAELPVESFELRSCSVLKVAKNNHIYLSADKHYYSVPHTLMGCTVKVAYTRSMVYIYYEGSKLAVHSKNFKLGAYSTVKEHLCPHHRHYRDGSHDYYRNLSAKISKVLYGYVCLLFEQKRFPE